MIADILYNNITSILYIAIFLHKEEINVIIYLRHFPKAKLNLSYFIYLQFNKIFFKLNITKSIGSLDYKV